MLCDRWETAIAFPRYRIGYQWTLEYAGVLLEDEFSCYSHDIRPRCGYFLKRIGVHNQLKKNVNKKIVVQNKNPSHTAK